MEESHPYSVKSVGTNFPGSFRRMGFVAFSNAMGNWCGNPCILHVMKYTIRWESDGKKVPILWEKYDYQFPRFSSGDAICCIFPCYEILMWKPMRFLYWWDLLISSCDFHLLKFILEKSIVLHHRINSNSNTFGTIHPRFWIKYETYILQLSNIFHFITRAFT